MARENLPVLVAWRDVHAHHARVAVPTATPRRRRRGGRRGHSRVRGRVGADSIRGSIGDSKGVAGEDTDAEEELGEREGLDAVVVVLVLLEQGHGPVAHAQTGERHRGEAHTVLVMEHAQGELAARGIFDGKGEQLERAEERRGGEVREGEKREGRGREEWTSFQKGFLPCFLR
jgi:hypothetical protein